MTTIWGVHNDHPSLDLVANGFISVGWDQLGDLHKRGSDKEQMKMAIGATYPDAKPGAIPVWAGILLRFAFEMQPGDLVIYPHRPDSTLNFGRIEGDYYWDAEAALHRNRRPVTWLKTGVPRAQFSKSARYEVGSAVTLFRVKHHAQEFEAFLSGSSLAAVETVSLDEAAEHAEDEPNAERIQDYTRDSSSKRS